MCVVHIRSSRYYFGPVQKQLEKEIEDQERRLRVEEREREKGVDEEGSSDDEEDGGGGMKCLSCIC